MDLGDHRTVLDASVGLNVWGPLGVELSATYTYSTVVLVGVDPQDLQVALGISATAPPRPRDR